MQKSKKGLLMSILWALVIITAVVSSVAMTQSAKVATLHLEQTWTYTPPQNIQVTFDANGGEFSSGGNTINETIKINTLSDGSIFPADEPTKSGYTFNGWEYSVNGTNYSDYASASDMPFTDHLYVRAKWEEVTEYTLIISFGTVYDTSFCETFQIWSDYSQATTSYGVVYNAGELVASYTDAFSHGEKYFEVKLRTTKLFLCIYGDCQENGEPVLEGLNFATVSHDPWVGVGFNIDTSAQVHSIYYSYFGYDP